MSTGSTIEWTEATWNPVVGCTRASAGCDHCYAVTMTHRLESMGQSKYAGLTVLNGKGDRHFNGTVRCVEDALAAPLSWKRPRLIFVNSMSDLFHKAVPFEFIDRVFAVMALCPQHTFQVLTKRPERMAEYLNTPRRAQTVGLAGLDAGLLNHGCAGASPGTLGPWPLPNVWLGASVEDSRVLDRIEALRACPAAVLFLSCEPLIGALPANMNLDGIGWVIVGGESGPGARAMAPEWVRSIRDQCVSAEVPFFFKQWGGVRKKDAGRELDGRTWDEMPEPISP